MSNKPKYRKPDYKRQSHIWDPPDVSQRNAIRKRVYLEYLKAAEEYQKQWPVQSSRGVPPQPCREAVPELPIELCPYEVKTKEVRIVEFQIPVEAPILEYTGAQPARIVGVVLYVSKMPTVHQSTNGGKQEISEAMYDAIMQDQGPLLGIMYREGAMHDGDNRLTCSGVTRYITVPSTSPAYAVRLML